MSASRPLSTRALNRALLARQLLLERARLPIPRALEQMGGLQAQYAPSMYIGLWSRVEGLARNDLTEALEKRTVAQGTLLRSTIHLVSADDYWPFALAIRHARRPWWISAHRGLLVEDDVRAAAARLRDELRANGPLRRKQLDDLLGRPHSTAVGMWVDLVRVPPSGTWDRRRADLYGLAEEWLGPPAPSVTEASGRELVVRRYLGGFGPATPAEIADWAGLPTAAVVKVLDRLDLRRFRTEDGTELVDLPGGPLPDPETPAPVRFLPTWDAPLLVHARRKAILAEEHRPLIFNTKSPHSFATFVVDGTVAGTWRYEKGHVAVSPFAPLPRGVQREVDEEAARLAAFHA